MSQRHISSGEEMDSGEEVIRATQPAPSGAAPILPSYLKILLWSECRVHLRVGNSGYSDRHHAKANNTSCTLNNMYLSNNGRQTHK